jgi:hypothetical protein
MNLECLVSKSHERHNFDVDLFNNDRRSRLKNTANKSNNPEDWIIKEI